MKHNWGCLIFFIPLSLLMSAPAAIGIYAVMTKVLGMSPDEPDIVERFIYLCLLSIPLIPLGLVWLEYFKWAKRQAADDNR